MPAPTFFDYFMVFLFANAAIVFNLILIPQHMPTLPHPQHFQWFATLPMVPSSVALDAALDCCCVHPPTATDATIDPLFGNGSFYYP